MRASKHRMQGGRPCWGHAFRNAQHETSAATVFCCIKNAVDDLTVRTLHAPNAVRPKELQDLYVPATGRRQAGLSLIPFASVVPQITQHAEVPAAGGSVAGMGIPWASVLEQPLQHLDVALACGRGGTVRKPERPIIQTSAKAQISAGRHGSGNHESFTMGSRSPVHTGVSPGARHAPPQLLPSECGVAIRSR